jgi:hypothetical protein
VTALRKVAKAAALLTVPLLLTAGCGATRAARTPAVSAPAAPSLATSLGTAAATWAIVPMGGSPAFWQLLRYPPAGTGWSVVTPPGVADNGGLVAADPGGQSLAAGVRPSKDLAYSPLAATTNAGKTWSPGILEAALADVPDALAATGRTGGTGRTGVSIGSSGTGGTGGHLLALLENGTAEETASATGDSGWSRLTTAAALAASPAARGCGLRALTAAAFSASGAPMLAGDCARPGTAGVFAFGSGAWRAVGPALPPSLAGRPVSTLRLATSGGRTAALLQVGMGRAASLLAAWTTGAGAGIAGTLPRWILAPPLPLDGAWVRAAGFGAGGALWLMLAGGPAGTAGAQTISGPGGPWHALPTLPAGTAALAIGSAGQFDALVTRGSTLTGWRLDPGSTQWHSAQSINVPIQYGSSG